MSDILGQHSPAGTTDPTRRPERAAPAWAVLLAVCAGQFLVVLDVSVVNVALPSMRTALGFGETGQQWVVNGYALAFAGFLLLGGRAADLFGRKATFLTGLGLFTAASLAGGLAQSPWMLITARAIQGLGSAVLAPTTLSMSGVGRGDQGLVSGLLNTSRQLGGALGLTVLATAAASRIASRAAGGASPAQALSDGYGLAFLIGAAFLVVGTALTVLLPKPAPRPAS